jgi:hypothetical protein
VSPTGRLALDGGLGFRVEGIVWEWCSRDGGLNVVSWFGAAEVMRPVFTGLSSYDYGRAWSAP